MIKKIIPPIVVALALVLTAVSSGCVSVESSVKVSKPAPKPLDTQPVLHGQDLQLDEGNSGTISIPYVGVMFTDTDVKKHWDMDQGVAKVAANLTWQGAGWALEFSTGTGECPDSGTVLASGKGDAGQIALEVDAQGNGTLEEGQWFVHIAVQDPTGHRGGQMPYDMQVTVFYRS